jgi:hypothetical protein
MSDLVSELFKRLGVAGVIAGAIATGVFATCIWALAHLAAAPGTQVSVLWGLAAYTKSPTQPDGPSTSPPAPASPALQTPPVPSSEALPADPQVVPSPATLEVTHGLRTDSYLDAVAELRASSGLRELRPIESDRPIHESPLGTFFIVLGPWLRTDQSSQGSEALLKNRVSRFQGNSRSFFEVHHRTIGQVLLIAYLVESDADRIRFLAGDHTFQLTVAPRPWTFFTSLQGLRRSGEIG